MLPPLPFPKADRMEVTTVANNMIRLDQYGEVFTAATGNSSAGLGRVSTIVTREEAMNLSKKLCALALGALLLVSGTVAARDGDNWQLKLVRVLLANQQRAQPVDKFYSMDGEGKFEFVARIAPALRAYTLANNVEVCGLLASDGERYGLVVMTVNSNVICLANQTPVEMAPTGETVHTHPRNGWHRMSMADAREIGVTSYRVHAEDFSELDGAGFLVTPTTVKFRPL